MTRRSTAATLASGLFASALACFAAEAAAQTAPPVDGTAVLGHLQVLDVLDAEPWRWSLGDDGLVIAWDGPQVAAWARVADGIHLALDGDRLAVVTTAGAASFEPPLARRIDVAFDGTAACHGTATAWAWTADPAELWYISATGRHAVRSETLPEAGARCSVSGDGAALVWDDGFGAVGVGTDGVALAGPWSGDASPRAVPDGPGWRLSAPDEAFPPGECARVGASSCPMPDPAAASAVALPRTWPPIAAVVLDDMVLVADRGGWSTITARPDDPSVERHAGPVAAAVFDADPPLVVTCSPDARPTVGVVRAADGETLAAEPLEACPIGARAVAGRLAIELPDRTLLVDPQVGSFADAESLLNGPPRPELVREWSAACAGIATSAIDPRSGRRVFGPTCEAFRSEDVRDPDGRRVGSAICRDAGTPWAVIRLDGSPLDGAVGSCDGGGFRLPTSSVPTAGASASTGARIDGARVVVGDPGQPVSLLVTADGVLVQGGDWLWASPTLWSRVVWWSGSVGRTLADPATEQVWRPSGLADALRRVR